MEVYILL